jgi:hypothetical protein
MHPRNFRSRYLFVFCSALLFAVAANAQSKQLFSFQKDDSLLKDSYYKQAKQKHEEILASIKGTSNAKDYKKIYEDRFEQAGDLIKSSRCVTDAKAHAYIQSVLKKIVQANPELQPLNIRLFFTRDWWPNAYSMGDGTIAINAGLFVFMQTEAELAFALSHELAHLYLDHGGKAIQKYVETVNSKEFQAELKRISKEQFRSNEQLEKLAKGIVFNSRMHSREKETEADKQGFAFFRKAGYNLTGATSCLNMLAKIDDSLLFKPLDLQQVFNLTGSPFNPKWVRKETSIFSQVGKADETISQKEKDSLKTHPDCEKRIASLTDSLTYNPNATADFIVDAEMFGLLKKNFFAEITEETFKENNLSRNLYYSLLQLQANENMPLAIYSTARCLVQVYESQKNHTLGKSMDRENKYLSNDYNLLLRMCSRITLAEIASLANAFANQYNATMQEYTEWPTIVQKIRKINQ